MKPESKLHEANHLVKKAIYWSSGVALLPLPTLDLAGIAAVQLNLVNDLSNLYGIKFCQHRVKNIIAVLLASVGTGTLLTGAVASCIKIIPGVGPVAGAISLPIVAGSSTYALGKVFIQHFEAGGTILDFDPEKTKVYFQQHFTDGHKRQTA